MYRLRVGSLLVIIKRLHSGANRRVGVILSNYPSRQVNLMDSVIDDVPTRVVPEPVPSVVKSVGIERPRRGLTEPHVVVHARRNGAVRLVADTGAQLHIQNANQVDVAKFS